MALLVRNLTIADLCKSTKKVTPRGSSVDDHSHHITRCWGLYLAACPNTRQLTCLHFAT